MTSDTPAPDTILLSPINIDPVVVSVAAPAARIAARRFVGRHDIDFARHVPDTTGEADDETNEG